MASDKNGTDVILRACMGGWCNRRENCANYGPPDVEPSERLCKSGMDAFVHRSGFAAKTIKEA